MDNKKSTSSRISSKELGERLWKIISRMLPFSTALPEIFDLIRDLSKQRMSLDNKIVKAHTSLQETSTLLVELEDGLKERAEKLKIIKAQYDQYSELAEVEVDGVRSTP